MKYILARTVGKITMADRFPEGELHLQKSPMCHAEYIAYSPDQSKVLIRCYDDTINCEYYGEELTVLQAEALYQQWQNDWDAKCTCFGKTNGEATRPQLNRPCMANVFAGICHDVIDESKPTNTSDYDAWRVKFDKRKREEFVKEAEERIMKRKQDEILGIAISVRTDPLTVKDSLDGMTIARQEIDAEIDKIINEKIESAKYRLVRHQLKTHGVPF